jgi:hypothetical protein
MQADAQADSGFGVVYEDQLPLALTLMPGPWEAAQRLRIENANVDFLKLLSALEESHEGDEDRDADLQRVEFKINLLLDLVAKVYVSHVPLPPALPVRLMGDGLEWRGGEVPAAGAWLQAELYISGRVPRPLTLVGQMQAAQEGRDYPHRLALRDASQVFQDALDRFIFRQHRRLVAYQRRGASR